MALVNTFFLNTRCVLIKYSVRRIPKYVLYIPENRPCVSVAPTWLQFLQI